MDEGTLLNLSASFERIALQLERDGLNEDAIERITPLAVLTLSQGLRRAQEGSVACIELRVPQWQAIVVYANEGHGQTYAAMLAYALRELSYKAKEKRLGFDTARVGWASDIALDPTLYTTVQLKSARNIFRAMARHSRNEIDRLDARRSIERINPVLEDRDADDN